ncbi:amidohydrolase family protein [Frankia gtarii]|uniref:amidohydrolase family protein n=1 Tax=Frankia gtarii TaxID=2950102 RepID=UPI0021BF23DA|nr:amidohydrolase family protein [Frankia gtarii]
MSSSTPTLLQGARVLVGDGRTVIDDAVILVRDGLIAEIGPAGSVAAPAEAERVDLRGKTVMPTIVNPHGHIGYLKGAVASKENYSRENVLDHLRRLAYYGVSVFQSLGTDREDIEITLRDEQRAGTLTDPELALLLTASRGLVAPTPGKENGGAFFAPDAILEAGTADEARALVRAVAAKNPDAIKFWVDDRGGTKAKFGPEVYSAIIDEGHRLGHIVIAHIFELADAKGVVRAGVDAIAHLVRAPGPDAELIKLMKDHDVAAFTSMGIQKGLPDIADWIDEPALAETVTAEARAALRAQVMAMTGGGPSEALTTMNAALDFGVRVFVENGVRVLMSADTGVLIQFFGFSEHREIEAIVDAGVSPYQAIAAATKLPAEFLHLDDRGTLDVGKRADLLVLDANPLDDITNTRKIAAVYLAGIPLDRAALRARWAAEGT